MISTEPQRAQRATAIVFVGAALLVALSILTRAVNHDEGQYVAAVAMMRSGWPYLDFPYLQTPLQPLLLSPLSMLPAGWLLVAARCANGLFALATLAILFGALRGRVQPRSALIAIAALACTEPFLLASSLARNDALPMILIAGAIAALVGAIGAPRSGRALALAGLLLGLATSVKISAAAPAAAAGLFVLLRARRFGPLGLGAFALGALAGLAPIAIAAIATPQHFWFGAFAYSLEAPQQWWTIVGRAADLEPLHRIGRLIELAFLGAMPFALVAAALDRRRGEERLLLDLMIVCGLVGAYLPEPPFTQYLVPVLPPLFARFAFAVDGAREHWRRPLLLLTVVAGLVYTGVYTVAGLSKGGIDLVQAVRQGRAVARLAAGGTIVTLSPEAFVGADTRLDRGFVTGPFLFRTYGSLGATALRLGFAPNWQRLDAALAARPPAVIVIGRETKSWPPLFPKGLDAPLADWAAAHGYAPVRLAGGSTAFVRRSAAR